MRSFGRCGVGSLTIAIALAACSDDATREPVSPTSIDSDPPAGRQVSPELFGGRPVSDTVGRGFTLGRYGSPIEVAYEVHAGLAIWDGDVIIGEAGAVPTSENEFLQRFADAVAPAPEGTQLGVVIDGSSFRWADGIVPYEIEAGLPNTSRIADAISIVEQATAGVNVVPRSGEDDFVRFVDADACRSAIGRQGGMQSILLGDGCSTGNAAHEILHALSMFHEQSRCDRDDFVDILLENVEEGREGNFDKECDDATDIDEYEEGSMMHYGPFAFSTNTQPTIVSLRGLDNLMGQRDSLSDTDVNTINELYGDNNDAPTAMIGPLEASYDEGSPVSFDGSGSSDPDDEVLLYAWMFGDDTCDADPEPSACTEETPAHTYVDNGEVDVTLTVSDGPERFDAFLEDEASAEVTVLNVAPSVDAGPDAVVTSAETFQFVGTFSDPGELDDPWDYEIDWGFDDPTIGSTDDQSQPIVASQQVCVAGQYNVVLSVTDKDGDTGTDSALLEVPFFEIAIDIMPGGDPTPINTRRRGRLPVAILSDPTFDATQIGPSTVVLGDELGMDTSVAQRNNGTYFAATEDVNDDGLPDLVVRFEVPALVANGDLHDGTMELVLRGFLDDECTNFRGTWSITTVP